MLSAIYTLFSNIPRILRDLTRPEDIVSGSHLRPQQNLACMMEPLAHDDTFRWHAPPDSGLVEP